MKTSRRDFISTAFAGGIAASIPEYLIEPQDKTRPESRYAIIDKIMKEPVLKTENLKEPVMIETLELLKYGGSWIVHVRSESGAEGYSIAHSTISSLFPIFLRNVQPFFIGQDARELDLILERIYIYNFNFRYNGITLGLPLACAEFAILDMLTKQDRLWEESTRYTILKSHLCLQEFREKPLEEHFDLIRKAVSGYDTNALKVKIGYQYAGTKDIHYKGVPGKTEKLIPLLRKTYGDNMSLYADSNGYYDVQGAIKVGRLLEEYKYRYFEEPVMYDHFEDIKTVADALELPVSNGEQDTSFVNFRWLLANDGLDIVQPDNYYFGGLIQV